MTVAENVRKDRNQVANNSLDGKKTTVDLWLHIFNHYPDSSFFRLVHQSLVTPIVGRCIFLPRGRGSMDTASIIFTHSSAPLMDNR